MPGGAKVEVTAISEDAVTMTFTLPTTGVCTAAHNTLGQGTASCPSISNIVFRQS